MVRKVGVLSQGDSLISGISNLSITCLNLWFLTLISGSSSLGASFAAKHQREWVTDISSIRFTIKASRDTLPRIPGVSCNTASTNTRSCICLWQNLYIQGTLNHNIDGTPCSFQPEIVMLIIHPPKRRCTSSQANSEIGNNIKLTVLRGRTWYWLRRILPHKAPVPKCQVG